MGGQKMFEHDLFFDFYLNHSIATPVPHRQLKINEPGTPQPIGKCPSFFRTSEQAGWLIHLNLLHRKYQRWQMLSSIVIYIEKKIKTLTVTINWLLH